GVYSKRINAKGAFSAMVIGFGIGIFRIILELNKSTLTGFWYDFANLNFLYFCIILFLISIALMIIISLLSEAPSEAQLNGLTFATTVNEDKANSRASWNAKDVWLSVFVIVMIVAIFLYFSPLGVGGA
ncbi:MAG: hypothetical protein NT127_06280, partial [Sphingobacteriales bacterium]|nr:hypothetical protein [Sphingobacteriales bacterium]